MNYLIIFYELLGSVHILRNQVGGGGEGVIEMKMLVLDYGGGGEG